MCTASAPTANMIQSLEVDQMEDPPRGMVALTGDPVDPPTEMEVQEKALMEVEMAMVMEREEQRGTMEVVVVGVNPPPIVDMNNRSRMERYQEHPARIIPTFLSSSWRRRDLQASSPPLQTRLSATILRMEEVAGAKEAREIKEDPGAKEATNQVVEETVQGQWRIAWQPVHQM